MVQLKMVIQLWWRCFWRHQLMWIKWVTSCVKKLLSMCSFFYDWHCQWFNISSYSFSIMMNQKSHQGVSIACGYFYSLLLTFTTDVSSSLLGCPKTQKSAQKIIGFTCPSFRRYVVCPKCNSIYNMEDCIMSSLMVKLCLPHVSMWNIQTILNPL